MSSYALYVDHQGHPAPLEESYHATATRRLSSSITNRGYPSTINSVDSAYCPQCLTVYTELGHHTATSTTTTVNSTLASTPTAATGSVGSTSSSGSTSTGLGYYCTKPACKLCPVCLSIVSIQLVHQDETTNTGTHDDASVHQVAVVVALYRCGNCEWGSDQCRLIAPLASSSSGTSTTDAVAQPIGSLTADSFGRIELARAANDLASGLYSVKRTSDEIFDQYWIQLTNAWMEETRRQMYSGTTSNMGSGGGSPDRGRGGFATSQHKGGSGAASNERQILRRQNHQRRNNEKEWSLETLEESLNIRKKKLSIQLSMMHRNRDGGKSTQTAADDNVADVIDDDDDITTYDLVQRKGLQIQRISVRSIATTDPFTTDVDDVDATKEPKNELPYFSYLQQMLNTPFVDKDYASTTNASASSSSILPLLVPLRLRTSRRCRMELSEGRPGILLKPKLNPLEGDSSLRTGQGQWYKKDCSAIAIIPRIDVIQHHSIPVSLSGTKRMMVVFLLKVSNPTLGTVRLRLTSSKYTGERHIFPDDYDDKESAEGTGTCSDLHDLVVDTIALGTPTIVHAKLVTSVGLQKMQPSETVELLSAEDSIIELGSVRARETPAAVLDWRYSNQNKSTTKIDGGGGDNFRISDTTKTTATDTIDIASTDPGESFSTIRLVAQSASDAWFELITFHDKIATQMDDEVSSRTGIVNNTDDVRLAFPIALQVELGNGSWESSLIPPDTTVTTETTTSTASNDCVTFDIVLVT